MKLFDALGLFKIGNNFPFLARVIHDRDVLSDRASGWNSELELGLDLLRDRRKLVLVEPDVGSVRGLEDDITGVGSWLGWVAVKFH